ncbi:hypothetical protein [Niallia hominis]|uniref:Uncharacterized protein n=1 Tax=Niallia hominis TaxID=3133173 RepID=A0ABV1F3Q0_9BACI
MDESKRSKRKSWTKYSIWSIALLLLIGFGTYGLYHHFSTDTIEGSVVSAEGEAIDKSIEASKSTEKEAEVTLAKLIMSNGMSIGLYRPCTK